MYSFRVPCLVVATPMIYVTKVLYRVLINRSGGIVSSVLKCLGAKGLKLFCGTCVCVCMYVCMYVRMYVCVCMVCMYVCMYVHTYVSTCVCVCACVCTCISSSEAYPHFTLVSSAWCPSILPVGHLNSATSLYLVCMFMCVRVCMYEWVYVCM